MHGSRRFDSNYFLPNLRPLNNFATPLIYYQSTSYSYLLYNISGFWGFGVLGFWGFGVLGMSMT